MTSSGRFYMAYINKNLPIFTFCLLIIIQGRGLLENIILGTILNLKLLIKYITSHNFQHKIPLQTTGRQVNWILLLHPYHKETSSPTDNSDILYHTQKKIKVTEHINASSLEWFCTCTVKGLALQTNVCDHHSSGILTGLLSTYKVKSSTLFTSISHLHAIWSFD